MRYLIILLGLWTALLCTNSYAHEDEQRSVIPSWSKEIAPYIVRQATPGTREFEEHEQTEALQKIARDLDE